MRKFSSSVLFSGKVPGHVLNGTCLAIHGATRKVASSSSLPPRSKYLMTWEGTWERTWDLEGELRRDLGGGGNLFRASQKNEALLKQKLFKILKKGGKKVTQ